MKDKRRKSVHIHTLGCKVNQYESEAMAEMFEKSGYEIVGKDQIADIYIINTCTVTNLGDKKSRQFIRKSKRNNPDAIIAVVGCYSQVNPNDIKNIEGVNLILGTNERKKIVEYIENLKENEVKCLVSNIMEIKEFEEIKIDAIKEKTRAFIKVQDGCNQYCTYCIIPYARGNIRSRSPENVIAEVKRLVEHGYKEIVLTGIHIASYGKDLKNFSLIDLIELADKVDGLERLRMSSVEPRLFENDFIERLKKVKSFCPHFHLSLQSGSDGVLKRMNRKYTSKEYLNTANLIYSSFNNAAITTDIIVGFPGETDMEFEETLEFVKKVGFSQVHVFQYSPKEGTKAALMENQIMNSIKHSRSESLIELTKNLEDKFQKNMVNQNLEILFEGYYEKNKKYVEGISKNYLRVIVENSKTLKGKVYKVNIVGIKDGILLGKLI
ncbi:tRNA (N(6)-L-threonylcarbamoyladenosine(37)-C(2))-methylthiotransferase MtaB [Helicovermis profundi]|uniref:tRNA (N(6)-L-threonylcarbamoyladenosine(37)-C(2))- methylthiotransferase MtaB n=1 Tax=Helicovermis profundi TaxID=3065157 RepID=UPI0030D2CF70